MMEKESDKKELAAKAYQKGFKKEEVFMG